MRRWLLCGITVITVVIAVFLGQTAVDPEDFTGDWYSASGQRIYRFHNGIISCEDDPVQLSDNNTISGAYIFAGKKVSLFVMGVDGLETVTELYLVEHKEESFLCDKADGTGEIYFIRSK